MKILVGEPMLTRALNAWSCLPGFRPRWRLLLLLIVYLGLAGAYNVLQPIGEAPDEPTHVEYVRYVQTHGTLPLAPPERRSPINPQGHEFTQAPLYYLLLAAVLSPVDLPPNADFHRNPYATWPGHPHQQAIALHRADEDWPYRGLALFVHLGRLVSTTLGLVTLLATYALIGRITGRTADAWFGTAWLALSPGFLLAGSRVNNDAAAMAASALTLLLCARSLTGPTRFGAVSVVGLNLALAAALLSKLHTLFLVPLALVAAVRGEPGRPFASDLGRLASGARVVALPLGLAGVWWLAYGRAFGDRLGEQAGSSVVWVWDVVLGMDLGRLPAALGTLAATWSGSAGFNEPVRWPGPVNALLAIPLVALGGAGLWSLAAGGRWHDRPAGARLAAALLGASAIPLLYATVARQVVPSVGYDAHARFILPAAPVIALVVALGRQSLPPGWPCRLLAGAYLLGLFGAAVVGPFVLFPQINAPTVPARLAGEQDLAAPALVSFANGVDLLGVGDLPPGLQPGSGIPLVLRWRVAAPPEQDFIAFVHLVNHSGERLAGVDAIPFEGAFPPRFWEPGELLDEARTLDVPKDLPPGLYALRIGVYQFQGRDLTPVGGAGGGTAHVVVGAWRVLPATSPQAIGRHSGARFGNALVLRGYARGEDSAGARVSLFWIAEAPIDRNLVVSVQLLDGQGRLVAQDDGEPVGGRLPTSTWATGELIQDDHLVAIPAESRQLRTILVVYDRQTGRRLPVSVAGSNPADYLSLE